MATKKAVFNGALTEIGHRVLTDTGEDVEAGRVLVERYDQVVRDCLSAGSWNFAMETIKSDADTGVTPEFGFTEVFAKPSDWMRTFAVSMDEYFNFPLLGYYDDASFWSADSTPIYIRYVSDDTGLGFELTRWPAAFARYVELELATRTAKRLSQDVDISKLEDTRDKARRRSLNHDAMDEPQPKFTPPGTWTTARGGRTSRDDRGNRGSLTG